MNNLDAQIQRGELSVSPQSWHYRLYLWWLSHGGGVEWGYRENLCHYMRVILFHVPLTWYFRVRLPQTKLTPFMLTVLWLAVVVATLGFYLDAFASVRGVIFLTVLSIVIALAIVLAVLAQKYERAAKITLIVMLSPVWIPVAIVLVPTVLISEHLIAPYYQDWTRWFFLRRYARVIMPWWVTVVAIWLGAFYLFGLEPTAIVSLWIVGIGLAIAVVVVVAGVIVFAFEALCRKVQAQKLETASRRDEEKGSTVPQPQHTSTLQIIWQFIVAKKARICPFITLPENPHDEFPPPSCGVPDCSICGT